MAVPLIVTYLHGHKDDDDPELFLSRLACTPKYFKLFFTRGLGAWMKVSHLFIQSNISDPPSSLHTHIIILMTAMIILDKIDD